MDAQRKLRNLLSYTKTDSVEELEDFNKLYEELLAYINKQEKVIKLLKLYEEKERLQNYHYIVTEKQSSLDKSKINKEFADEMKKYKELLKQIQSFYEGLEVKE